ncbi:MAG TPA: hypothetical protein DF364_06400 [Ruminococcaceae bacterium]|nr:hypothetical protein [Oscillospiraceae bacterium]
MRPVTGPTVGAFHAAAPRWLVSVFWESLQPKAFLSKGKTGGHWSFQRILTFPIINTGSEKCQWGNCRKGVFFPAYFQQILSKPDRSFFRMQLDTAPFLLIY